jgi:hypothetical protein
MAVQEGALCQLPRSGHIVTIARLLAHRTDSIKGPPFNTGKKMFIGEVEESSKNLHCSLP